MDNNYNIYSRLLDGEKLDDILREITDEANAAQARIEAERKAAEEAAREDAARKREAARRFISHGLEFMAEFYPALGLETEPWDDEDLDALVAIALPLLDLEVKRYPAKDTPRPAVATTRTTDDIFADFFHGFGL